MEVQKASRFARLEQKAALWHDLAAVHEAKKETNDYRNALSKEYETREQQRSLDATRIDAKTSEIEAAARLARSYREGKQMSDAAVWTERAADLGHAESQLQLADWYEKGDIVKRDPDKAARFRHTGHQNGGLRAYNERRYDAAAASLAKACASPLATALDLDLLGRSYGKLNRWDEAVAAYTRSVELDVKSVRATGVVLNLLEALVCADRPEQLLQFTKAVKAKGWEIPKTGEQAARNGALVPAFQAIALTAIGKDASEALRAMRQFTAKPPFKVTNWTWDELEQWLKTTKLAPARKAAVEKIIVELKGNGAAEPKP